MRLQPIGKSLLVEVKPAEKKGGILLLQRPQDEPFEVVVMGVGDKVESPIKTGDVLLLGPYCGVKVPGGNEEAPYLLIGEKDIIGIWKE